MKKSVSQKVFRVFVFVILLFFIILGGVFVQGKEIAANAPKQQKYYTSIRLEEGDSLWTVAQRYCRDGQDLRPYIQEIQEINHIVNERALPAGSQITVYYWGPAGE